MRTLNEEIERIKPHFIVLICVIGFTSCLFSQKIVRSTLGTLGSSKNQNGMVLQQSAGQPALTSNEKLENGTGLRQGFIQPNWYEEERNELDIELYPNPNKGVFYFQVKGGNTDIFHFEIKDQMGRVVLQELGQGNTKIEVSIPNPARGVYYFSVSQANKNSFYKINVIL